MRAQGAESGALKIKPNRQISLSFKTLSAGAYLGVDGVSVSFPGITIYMTPFTINPLPENPRHDSLNSIDGKSLKTSGLKAGLKFKV